jgi:hypothetical protein
MNSGYKKTNLITTLTLLFCTSVIAQNTPLPLSVTIHGDSVLSTRSDYFFGHNYWQWCPSWGDLVSGTESQVMELNVKFLRFGGMQADLGYPDKLINGYLSKFYSYAKKIGAEPLLQVQIARQKTTEERVANALEMIKYFSKRCDLKYVSIGNEPDIYASNLAPNAEYNAEYLDGYGINEYCKDFNAVAAAIKKTYPGITIIGLELSWNREEWVPEFVARCKDNIDMISLHYYPFTAGQCTYDQTSRHFNEIVDFYRSTRVLIDKNAGGKVIPLVIGETNITWDGDPNKSILDASPGTFAAALWFADYAGVSSAQQNLFSIMPWGIREGWKLGFIASRRNPVYFVYKMFSDMAGKYCIHCEKVNEKVRIYAYKDDSKKVSVLVVNWDTTNSYCANIAFSGILHGSTYACILPPFSLSAIAFSPDMKDTSVYLYTKDLAMHGPVSNTSPKFKAQFKTKRKKAGLRIRPLR